MVVTVIALVLGLTVLQLSSTQFSPRLLRNFPQGSCNSGGPERVQAAVKSLRSKINSGRQVKPTSAA
jgi:hypothetical protein